MQKHLVNLRRKREEVRCNGVQDIQREFRLKNRAVWEQDTEKTIERNEVLASVKYAQLKRRESVNHRRSKLANLVQEEVGRYKVMIGNMAETPQLKRERMLERANEIKRKTEDVRLKFVDECYERRFREECDEMNAHKGQSLLLACSQQQRRQMEEKDMLARLDDEREEKYARLWEEDMRRKEFAERAKLDKAARARQDSIDGVAAQMVEVNARKEEEKQRAEAEQQMRLDWEKAKDQDDSERRERERQRLEKRREEVLKYTNEVEQRKKAELDAEKSFEKEYIETVLAKEESEKVKEEDKREGNRQDIHDYMAYLNSQRREKEELDRQLDKLREEQLEIEYRKRALQWDKEKLARERLLKTVLQGRQEQVDQKRAVSEREHQSATRERTEIDVRLVNARRASQQKEARLQEERLVVQKFQRMQIEENSKKKSDAGKNILNERLALEQRENEYMGKFKKLADEDAEKLKTPGNDVHYYPLKRLIT
eukprot:132366_1